MAELRAPGIDETCLSFSYLEGGRANVNFGRLRSHSWVMGRLSTK